MSDPSRPNLADLDEAALSTKCARCQVVIAEESSVAGTTMVSFYTPATGNRQRMFLCGLCGLAFKEFMIPQLADDESFQQAKTALQAAWG